MRILHGLCPPGRLKMRAMEALITRCLYLGRALQMPPDRLLIDETIAIAREVPLPGLERVISALAEAESADTIAGKTAEDHLRLFSGPDPLAPPWESVWRERDRLLFGDCTAEVARIYANWGLEISQEGREPQDHLGLELCFLGYLLQLGQENNAECRGKEALREAGAFLWDHILRFAPQVLDEASKQAQTPYYREVMDACASLLKDLEQMLAPNQNEAWNAGTARK